MKIKAVIFDCDGTLVDSEKMHFAAWKETLARYGYDLQWEEYVPCMGRPDALCSCFFAEKIGSSDAAGLLLQKIERFAQIQEEAIFPIEHTVNFARLLIQKKHELGLSLGVASAARKSEILRNLNHLNLTPHLDVIISGEDDLHEYQDREGVNKPKPYIYLHAAKLLGLQPHECVAIEDSHPGVTAAVSAGLITVAVPNALTRIQDLSHASCKIESFHGMDPSAFFQTIVSEITQAR